VLIVSGIMQFEPSHRDECLMAMQAVTEASIKEDGCVSYGFYEDLAEPARFRVWEHWADEEHFLSHFQTPHYLEFMDWLGRVGMTAVDVDRFDVASSTSLSAD